jgi:hypothetical protein
MVNHKSFVKFVVFYSSIENIWTIKKTMINKNEKYIEEM